MRLNLRELLSRLNSSYWFVPLIVTLAGLALAVLLLVLDTFVSVGVGGVIGVIRPSSPDGARALLSAVIGAMITAISVTFSVTIVALTVAAQHFGPRVLNNFVRHTSAQVVLGTFLATFAYSVLVLGAVRGTGPEDADIPELAVSGAVALVVLSIGALIYYVHHVSTSLQIGELAAEIAQDFRSAIERLDVRDEGSSIDGVIPEAPEGAAEIAATESGYVQRVDYATLVQHAEERGATVWVRRETGAFVVEGTPLALVHPRETCDETLAHAVRHACIIGRDRTLWHDPEFAVKQLVEVALRALSPGVNEPFTAVTCIDRLTEGLACAAVAPAPRAAWRDAEGRPRVFSQPHPFATLLRASFDPIRIFAGTNPAIYARLLDSLTELSLVGARAEDQTELHRQAQLIRRAADAALTEPDDRAFVELRFEHAMKHFRGGVTSTRKSPAAARDPAAAPR